MKRQATLLSSAAALVALLSGCSDTLIPGAEPPPQRNPNLLGRLECTVSRETLSLSCVDPSPVSSSGGPRLGWVGNGEVKLRSFNVSYDTTTLIFKADVNVENLLAEMIGTPNGTTPTGIRVFHHDGPKATSYYVAGATDTVVVANADGYRQFTKPNQPYFQYDTILAQNDTSATKEWRWSVPRTVKTFSFVVMVDADLPSEAQVPGLPPDSVPSWVYSPTNIISGYPSIAGRMAKDVVIVLFKPYTTQPMRRQAIAAVGGTVIGGQKALAGDGLYYVQIPGNGSSTPAFNAANTLNTMSQVQFATEAFVGVLRAGYVRPEDSPQFRAWQVRPDSADGQNWAPEAVSAMWAWGCSRGDTTARVAVVDHDFHSQADLTQNQFGGFPAFDWFTQAGDTIDHGTSVAAIIAGRGNNNDGITGMMWVARLRMYDAAVALNGDTSYTGDTGQADFALTARLLQAGGDGADVINVSWGIDWWAMGHPQGYDPGVDSAHIVAANHALADRMGRAMAGIIRYVNTSQPTRRPLWVIAAGNNNLPAYWSGLPNARDSFPSQVLVVGSASRTGPNTFAQSWFSNYGPLVEIYAPGEAVYSLNRTASPVPVSGTSFAAPHVVGVAGLMLSFDPRLGGRIATADSIRRLILGGARLGRRSINTTPFLNAYEALRATAGRRTAPLCGNPVYQDSSGRMWVKRDTFWIHNRDTVSTRLEQIFTTTDTLPDVKHGGRRIRYASGNGREWHYSGMNATWDPASPVADTIVNATNRSKNARSHGDFRLTYVDSTITVAKSNLSSTATTRTERLTVQVNGTTLRTIDVTVPKKQYTTDPYNGCVYWYVSDPTHCLLTAPFSPYRDSTATIVSAAMSPAGDSIVVAVARDSFAYVISAPLGNGSTFERPYGDYQESIGTDLYFIPVRGAGATRGPVRVTRRVEVIGYSEDGRRLVTQTRDKFYSEQSTVSTTSIARHNLCSANYYFTSGTQLFVTSTYSVRPWAVDRPCYPGSMFAP